MQIQWTWLLLSISLLLLSLLSLRLLLRTQFYCVLCLRRFDVCLACLTLFRLRTSRWTVFLQEMQKFLAIFILVSHWPVLFLIKIVIGLILKSLTLPWLIGKGWSWWNYWSCRLLGRMNFNWRSRLSYGKGFFRLFFVFNSIFYKPHRFLYISYLMCSLYLKTLIVFGV